MKLFKKPDRLWVAEQRGVAVFLLAGRPNAPGTPKAREFKSADAARAFLEAEREKKLAEGYEVIDVDAVMSGPFTVDGTAPAPRAPPRRFAPHAAQVRVNVRGGYLDADDLDQVIDDLVALEQQTPHALRAHLEEIVRAESLAVRAKKRPQPCVNEALDAAFAELTANGIVALQNAGFTQSDAWAEINAELARRTDRPPSRGGCFFHFQDLERAVNGRGLLLGFAAFGVATDEEHLAVGRLVVETLRRHGVEVDWSGAARDRISIRPFEWFRPSAL